MKNIAIFTVIFVTFLNSYQIDKLRKIGDPPATRIMDKSQYEIYTYYDVLFIEQDSQGKFIVSSEILGPVDTFRNLESVMYFVDQISHQDPTDNMKYTAQIRN